MEKKLKENLRSSTENQGNNSISTKNNFRFFDNRQKYLQFVSTCSEKEIISNLINNNYEISMVIDKQKNYSDNHSVFVVDNTVKSMISKSEKCNGQFIGIVKFSKKGSAILSRILDNFHKRNNLEGETIRIFEITKDMGF